MARKPSKIVKIGELFHTWEVKSQAEGYNYNCKCIECGSEKVINKYNLLRNTYAICRKCGVKSILESNIDEILKYWNKDLNGSYTTQEILENPTATYWFTCSKGHNFRKTIRDFTPETCPTCKKLKKPEPKTSIKKLDGVTFAQCYPHLMEHWNYRRNKDKPTDILMDVSKRKYWFTCSEGHEFNRTPNDIRKGLWCPYCSDSLHIERLRIITQTFMEASFDNVYYSEDDEVIIAPENKIVVSIQTFDNPSDSVDVLFKRAVIKKKYFNLGYTYLVFYATKNLEKDVDIMKNGVLRLT